MLALNTAVLMFAQTAFLFAKLACEISFLDVSNQQKLFF